MDDLRRKKSSGGIKLEGARSEWITKGRPLEQPEALEGMPSRETEKGEAKVRLIGYWQGEFESTQ